MTPVFKICCLGGALAAAAFMSPSVSGQTSLPPADPQLDFVARQHIDMDRALTNPQNPSGADFHFDKIDESPAENGHLLRYRMLVPKALGTSKQPYRLAIWRIGSERKFLRKAVFLNARGLLMRHSPLPDQDESESFPPQDEVETEFVVARGEPVRFLLRSASVQVPWGEGSYQPI